jgi:hypothetical protein
MRLFTVGVKLTEVVMAYIGPMTTEGKNRIMIYDPKEDGGI